MLYIEPQRSILTPFVDRRTYGWDLNFRFGLRQDSENLYVYTPFNPLPFNRIHLFDAINDTFILASIRRVVRRLEMKRPILWLYYTKMASMSQAIQQMAHPWLICYDCYDHYAGYGGVRPSDKPRVLAEERELVQMADVVFVVSEPLYADKEPFTDNIFLVPNGVDMTLYETTGPIPDDVALIPHPIVGFTGKIAGNKVDLRLIRYLVENRPSWSVVLVGPVFPDLRRVIAKWQKYENLYLLGERSPEDLPAYLSAFDVCIAPYLDNEQLRYSDALKIYEYLAAGKPIVATGLPDNSLTTSLVQTVATPQDFVARIEASIEEDDEILVSNRIDVAQQNSWDRRLEQIEEILASLLLERA